MPEIVIGMDVGSTTAKVVVLDLESRKILLQDYQRHQTKQAEKVLEYLEWIEKSGVTDLASTRIFLTGSGAAPLLNSLNGKFVQEVNAVTLAVSEIHPDVGSVVELGGQDAKVIIFKVNETTGDRQIFTSMNDKCASGTGATIDKCFIKVGADDGFVKTLRYENTKLHHVAAKCGVFAETDIVNLVKSGVPSNEILCSLADAIVMQNLSVLTRGNTLRHKVLLLGGPNTYLPFLQDIWRKKIPQVWKERGYQYPKETPIEDLIFVPENAQYYAAFGSALFAPHEKSEPIGKDGIKRLKEFISNGRKERLKGAAGPALAEDSEALTEFQKAYAIPLFTPAKLKPKEKIKVAIGLDGGSTSSKCVLLNEQGEIVKKEYQLSKGNPIQDMKEMFARLEEFAKSEGAEFEIIGCGVTGYAGDIMEKVLRADANIVETVAHMLSAVHYFGDVDVICDIGGQDIKVLMMKDQAIRNFRLSNQCSAGNGMLLQAMADQFGVPVKEYAATAFRAELSPKFSYGCAVFLDSDRVNFQKEGFSKEEMLAGLAMVLPKNVWQYVVQIPRMAELGRRFVLQGGTQYNMAAVKAQVDYIKERVPGAEVFVHPHCGEAGAIGAALEALRIYKKRGYSEFIGLSDSVGMTYTTQNDESTKCRACPNLCSRTFVDAKTPAGESVRYISGFSCEKGTVESTEALQKIVEERKKRIVNYPNLVDFEAKYCFASRYQPEVLPEAESSIDDIAGGIL